MSNVEVYSLSVDFPLGLYNNQFQIEVDEAIVAKTCLSVDTCDDIVNVVFDLDLDVGEKTQLDNIVLAYIPVAPKYNIAADNFCMLQPQNLFEAYELIGFEVTNGIVNYPSGFTKTAGNMDYFDPVTGYFNNTGSPSIFLYNIAINSVDANTTTELQIRVRDNVDVEIFGDNKVINPTGEIWCFMGNGGLLTALENFKFSLEINGTLPLTCNVFVKFVRLFS